MRNSCSRKAKTGCFIYPQRVGRIVASLILLATLPLHAGQDRLTITSGEHKSALVELYTSEGCSSCPPADQWLASLGKQDGEELNLIPLAFHVDYWNDLGWVDPFSSPEFTARQRAISRRNHQPTIYTPEFVVNGREVRGNRKVISAVTQSNTAKAPIAIRLAVSRKSSKQLQAAATVYRLGEMPVQRAQLYAALFENDLRGTISAGENAGKMLHHDYVVRSWVGPLQVSEEGPVSFDIQLAEEWRRQQLGLAVIVLDNEGDELLQAIKTPLAGLF